jgi:hypothetical protein
MWNKTLKNTQRLCQSQYVPPIWPLQSIVVLHEEVEIRRLSRYDQ